jgi:NTP pyrophosphatase (non-canonical NTP hydrolase)
MEAIDRILSSSARAQARSIDSVFKNLVEEVGELSRALNRPWRCDEPAIGEIADVMNCVVDLAYMLTVKNLADQGIGEKAVNVLMLKRQIEDWVDSKCNKWDGLVEGMKNEAVE